ncbi:mitochondrial ornithine carrier protein [Cystobasidiomycetes sp. EMM_F5]
MAENATLFVVYTQTQAILRTAFPSTSSASTSYAPATQPAPLPLSQIAVAGGCAGAVTSFVLTPIELVKVRMQVQMIAQEQYALASSVNTSSKPALPGPVKLVRSVLQQYGARGLWLGQTGTFIREAGGSVAWFGAFEAVCRAFIKQRQKKATTGRTITKDDLTSPELMLAGAAAGTSYTVVLFPADCIKSTIQTGDELAKDRKPAGFLQIGRDIYRARGIRGLYSGCGVTVVRSAPSSAIIFWIYSLLERKFG